VQVKIEKAIERHAPANVVEQIVEGDGEDEDNNCDDCND
jgi:hypothetical protein